MKITLKNVKVAQFASEETTWAIACWHGNPNIQGRLMYTITRERAGEIVAEARKEGW